MTSISPKTKLLVVAIFTFATLFFGCKKPSVVPKSGDEEHSIASLKTLYSGAPTQIRDNILITGTVISSDREGNFYQTLVVEDATGGIEIKLGVDEIFKHFRIHTRATIRCQGLWLGSYGGTLQLGSAPMQTFETEPLTEIEMAEHLTVDATFYGEIVPRESTISDLSARDISTFVLLSGVRFAPEEEGLSWAETDDESPYATDRYLIDSQGNRLAVRTSRYASFARRMLPRGEGKILGVAGYFDDRFQLVVTDAMAFSADEAE